jgi:rubrerythrin
MHEMTANNLRSAYGGESMAHMRYKIWAQKAMEDGFPNVARLFTAISHAEQTHATNHFTALSREVGGFSVSSGAPFGLGATSQNLQGAINGELFEINEMYPVYLTAARFQQEKDAERSFHYALFAERIHAAMYEAAKKNVAAGRDVRLGPVQICEQCGFTYEGEMPDKCPVCGAGKEKFKTFAE